MPIAATVVSAVLQELTRTGCLVSPGPARYAVRLALTNPKGSTTLVLDNEDVLHVARGRLDLETPVMDIVSPMAGPEAEAWRAASLETAPKKEGPAPKKQKDMTQLDLVLLAREHCGKPEVFNPTKRPSPWDRLFEEQAHRMADVPAPLGVVIEAVALSALEQWDSIFDRAHKDLFGIDKGLANFDDALDSLEDARMGSGTLTNAALRIGTLRAKIKGGSGSRSRYAVGRLEVLVLALEAIWTGDDVGALQLLSRVTLALLPTDPLSLLPQWVKAP